MEHFDNHCKQGLLLKKILLNTLLIFFLFFCHVHFLHGKEGAIVDASTKTLEQPFIKSAFDVFRAKIYIKLGSERGLLRIKKTLLPAPLVYTVTSTANTGVGSLHEAINNANANTGIDTIKFNLAGSSPHTISLTTNLPNITEGVVIDGTTQTGTVIGSLIDGVAHALQVEIVDGGSVAQAFNIAANVNDVTIRGLGIGGFNNYGIYFSTNANSILVEACVVGTNINGTTANGNGSNSNHAGIYFADSDNSVVRNCLVSGNVGDGIAFRGASDNNHVYANLCGLDMTGTVAIQNTQHGVFFRDSGSNNIIGGTTAVERNVLSGGKWGFHFWAGDHNRGENNYVGTDITGTKPIGNSEAGVEVCDGNFGTITKNVFGANDNCGVLMWGSNNTGWVISNNYIGTDLSETENLGNGAGGICIYQAHTCITVENNVIAYSKPSTSSTNLNPTGATGAGIWLRDNNSETLISQNVIYDNTTIAIDNNGVVGDVDLNDDGDGDTGPNGRLNYPVIDSVWVENGSICIEGWSGTGNTVEFFIAEKNKFTFGESKGYLFSAVEGSADDQDATTSTYGPSDINGVAQGTYTNAPRFRFCQPTSSLPKTIVHLDSLVATASDLSGSCSGVTSEFSAKTAITICDLNITNVTSDNCAAVGNTYTARWNIDFTTINHPDNQISYQRNSEAVQSYTLSGNIGTIQIPNIPADGGVYDTLKVWTTNEITCIDTIILKRPLPCPPAIVGTSNPGDVCNTINNTEIAGTVWEDWDYNGVMNESDLVGVQGVEVNAVDDCNNVTQTTFTDSNGNYQFTGLTTGTTYRVAFSLPETVACWAKPTRAGTNNGTTVQFVQPGNCASLGLANPADYCQDDPVLMINCYVAGAHNDASRANEHTIVGINYSYGDDVDGNINGTTYQGGLHNAPTYSPAPPQPTPIADFGDIGSTWGVAYARSTQTLFSSAYIKSGSSLGPGESTGAIFATTDPVGTPAHSLYVDLNAIFGANTAGVNPHPIATTDFTYLNDSLTNAVIGKVGLGDLAITSDESHLFVVNLADRMLYKIPTTGALNTTTIQRFAIPTNNLPTVIDAANTPGTCPTADVRPFGLGFNKQDELFVGAVCSCESISAGPDANPNPASYQMTAYVWKFDGSSFNLVLDQPLRFDRDGNGSYRTFDDHDENNNNWDLDWEPWSDLSDPALFNVTITAQNEPLLADITFDVNGDMLLGMRDRSGDIVNLYGGYTSSGDVYRACLSGVDNWTFENNATCGTLTTAGANNNEGPGGGEYYHADRQNDGIENSGTGGIFVLKGKEQVVSAAIDPIYIDSDGNQFFNPSAGGIQIFDSKTGDLEGAYNLYDYDDSQASGGNAFGKAAGIGAIAAFCEPAPLEIGNYVWCDSIQNGIQDACERGVDSLIVRLYDRNNNLVGQDTTIGGNYYFNPTNVDTTGITIDANGAAIPTTGWTGLSHNTDYQIVFGFGQYQNSDGTFQVGSQVYAGFTTFNAGDNDELDSDVEGTTFFTFAGSKPRFYPEINLRTAGIGCGDHSYDLGLLCGDIVYSLGNQVFLDSDNSGDLNGAETGIDGIQLRLLNSDQTVYDSDTNTAGIQPLTVTTANGGYYRFDELPAGNYRIEVLVNNFATGNNLAGLASSTGANEELAPNSNTDSNDNGIDIVAGAVRSRIVTLGGLEPTDETEPTTYGAGSTTGTASVDWLSNLTVDFGFKPNTISATTTTICNDNGTIGNGNSNDDTFTIRINVTNSNPGAVNQYVIMYDGNTLNPGGTTYGTEIIVIHPDFVADGTFSPTLIIQDADDSNCAETVVVPAVENCSDCPPMICLPIQITINKG